MYRSIISPDTSFISPDTGVTSIHSEVTDFRTERMVLNKNIVLTVTIFLSYFQFLKKYYLTSEMHVLTC